jgi:uncharacterized membrane protein YgdD (TMEM256/DUF423 family)
MTSIARRWIAIGAVIAAIGVGLGAYGAHGLHGFLERFGYSGDDLARRIGLFETAVRYQMVHAIGLVLVGLTLDRRDSRPGRFAAWALLVGMLLFCCLLKVMTFAGPEWKWLGGIVPLGGVSMIVGWLALAVAALGSSKAI